MLMDIICDRCGEVFETKKCPFCSEEESERHIDSENLPHSKLDIVYADLQKQIIDFGSIKTGN